MFHEIIPHNHPDGDSQKINILTGNDENNNENNKDEKGVLDDLEIILFKRISYVIPFFINAGIFITDRLPDFNNFYFPDLIAYLKYFSTKSPPNDSCIYSVSLLRGPPSLL